MKIVEIIMNILFLVFLAVLGFCFGWMMRGAKQRVRDQQAYRKANNNER